MSQSSQDGARRRQLEAVADQAVQEVQASGGPAAYRGGLPPGVRAVLAGMPDPRDAEAKVEDLFAERMIALTRTALVEDVDDEHFEDAVIARSHERPVLVDVYSDFCRPCQHVLPIVQQLAREYVDALTVVKINVTANRGFRETYLGIIQLTPAFLFFHDGQALPACGRLARLLGQSASPANTRDQLERWIRAVLRRVRA